MTRATKGTSPSRQSGGDDARDLYVALTDDLLYDPAIGRATMMGYPCGGWQEGSWRPTTTRPPVW